MESALFPPPNTAQYVSASIHHNIDDALHCRHWDIEAALRYRCHGIRQNTLHKTPTNHSHFPSLLSSHLLWSLTLIPPLPSHDCVQQIEVAPPSQFPFPHPSTTHWGEWREP